MDFKTALLLLPGLIIGLTVHEAAHAISAKWLGDRTAEKMGRVSLNPLRHLSIYGTLALFILHFGWGKPVIVNLYNFKKPKFYYLLSSLAGPVSNLIICGICLGVLYMRPPAKVSNYIEWIYLINGILAAVNLIPIPPLDGSKIWPCLIPGMKPTISGKWSMVWVVVLIIALKTGGVGKVLRPVSIFMDSMLPGYKVVQESTNETRPEGFPEDFSPIEGASLVRYISFPVGSEDPNCYAISYSVAKKNQTEDSVFNSIRNKLSLEKWVKLDYQLVNPDVKADFQWQIDKEAEYMWNSELVEVWGNNKNEVTVVNFLRSEDKKWKDWVGCRQYLHQEDSYEGQYLKIYKQLHPEEFEGIEVVE